ncbi:sodium:calcium exchanger [Mastigocoleus sp. MO_188.B34]|uniref:sodium:calcium antiporter n=1 Tax=Mastigocoleus sp. MO_188.B34 TaxID=3036635 RepID=UPI002613EAB5|nr:sodium:calcium exchanger [Mastigocoleus sp. MO_188.B34]MDJ0695526.1 sodium:calcium exchanger [Mastigocoleus sp. MO_188.B34]
MNLFLWFLVLLGAVIAAHWGADKLAEPLQKLRKRWGLSEAAAAAFVALATASPEVGTNVASAVAGLQDIGLGNLLGSNIISVPAIVTVSYIASVANAKDNPQVTSQTNSNHSLSDNPQTHALRVKPEALTVQAIPYLLIIALAAILTLPQPWRGLQPIDGWIMLVAYFVYLAQAVMRERQNHQTVEWEKQEIMIAITGILSLCLGAYLTVKATENIVSLLGISQLVGGLFITSTMSIAPEVFATWSVARSGQLTAATTNVIADNTATMTLAFFPLALVSLPVKDLQLYSFNLTFVALLGVIYAAVIHWGAQKYSFELWEVVALNGVYLVYLGIMVFGILNVF